MRKYNTYMSFRLGDILKEHYPVSSDFKRFSVGWYRKKKLWKSIEPSRGKGWETADLGPIWLFTPKVTTYT